MFGEGPGYRVLPRGHQLRDDALHRLFVDGVLQPVEIEIEHEYLNGVRVLRGDRIDGAEAVGERAR